MCIGFEHIETYIPDARLGVRQFYEEMENQYHYKPKENEIDLFIEISHYNEVAVENEKDRIEMIDAFFKQIMSKYNGEDFDYVIFSTDIPEAVRDKIVYQLMYLNKYGIHNANYITMNLQCATQLNAVCIAESLISRKKAKRILIVSHSFKDELKRRWLEGYGIIGDGVVGAGATFNSLLLRY